MRLRTAAVTGVQAPIRLPSFQGVLALDNDCLSRVHARFAGEVVELGRIGEGSGPTLHVGDRVCQGDLLAVIWSTELGKKKSELVDALAKLRAEVQLRDRLKKLFDEGAGAGRTYRDAEKDVQARRVEIASLERTLRTWRVTDEDIEDIRAEVEHLADGTTPAIKSGDWARVEVRRAHRRRDPRKERDRRRYRGHRRRSVQDRRLIEHDRLVRTFTKKISRCSNRFRAPRPGR